MVTLLSVPALASSSLRAPMDVSTWNITYVNSKNVVIPHEEFQYLIQNAPVLLEIPRFQQLLTEDDVTLTPQDIFTMFCYTDKADKAAQLRSLYANQVISVNYTDGIFDIVTFSAPSNTLPRGGGGTVYNSLTHDKCDSVTRYGLRVTYTIETYQKWPGGSTVYVEVTDITRTEEASQNAFATYQDIIDSEIIDKSSGSKASTYVNIDIVSKFGVYKRRTAGHHYFEFKWENGVYTGETYG